MSMAMTRAPMATANCVADKPTGPWPKMAIVSPPCKLIRFKAPHAVPVPQETAAHARGLVLAQHASWAGGRIGKHAELQLPISEKHDVFHGCLRDWIR